MPGLKKRVDFYDSAEGVYAEEVLRSMLSNEAYDTSSTYTTNTDDYPDHRIPFVDKHMQYLSNHPKLDINHYLSNLRMIARV